MTLKKLQFRKLEISFDKGKKPALYYYQSINSELYLFADEEFEEIWQGDSILEFLKFVESKVGKKRIEVSGY